MIPRILITVAVLSFPVISFAKEVQLFESPSEVFFVDTDALKVSIWKRELLGGQITVEDKGCNYTKIFPCFFFGTNSSDGRSVKKAEITNGYKMFLAEAEGVRVKEKKDYLQVRVNFPYSVYYYNNGKLFRPPPPKEVFSATVEVLVYKNKPRIDIKAVQNIREDLFVHVSFFQQFIFQPFGFVLFGTEPQTTLIEPKPWEKLRFLHKTPKGEIRFLECHYDEKPPFKSLKLSSGYRDFWVMLSKDEKNAVLVYSPSWQKYASLGYNRRIVPDNCILFNGTEDLSSGRVAHIIKDTTLGAGLEVLRLEKGEYPSNITLLFLPYYKEHSKYDDIYKELIDERQKNSSD